MGKIIELCQKDRDIETIRRICAKHAGEVSFDYVAGALQSAFAPMPAPLSTPAGYLAQAQAFSAAARSYVEQHRLAGHRNGHYVD